jgi:hypothetical protein
MTPRDLLPLINPKLHPKYSPNLYNWIRKNWSKVGSLVVVTNPGEFGGRYIGLLHDDGWMSASPLNAVLCNGEKERTMAVYPSHSSRKAGVDETFWERYIQDGRCAIDPEHQVGFVGNDTRWKYDGKVRECQWCGHHVQVQLDWTEVVNHSDWVPA